MLYLLTLIAFIGAFACGVFFSPKVRGRLNQFIGQSFGLPEEFNTWLTESHGKFATMPEAVNAWLATLKGKEQTAAKEALEKAFKKYYEFLVK